MLRVLIVDDDKATVDVIRDSLDWKSLDVGTVREACNIGQAQALLEQENADIVISDIEMPKGSGLDLLHWFRERNLPGEFLLLTCHESFPYASQALHERAAEYLLKPFDAQVMEMTLRRVIARMAQQRRLQEDSLWMQENQRRLQLAFLSAVFTGQYDGSPDKVRQEIAEQKFALDAAREYSLVITRVTDLEHDRERFGQKLLLFALENIHSELLCGRPENSTVVCMDYKSDILVAAVCEPLPVKELDARCARLLADCKGILTSVLTCCICEPCRFDAMFAACRGAADRIAADVANYGGVLHASDALPVQAGGACVLDMKFCMQLLQDKQKKEFLEYLKKRLDDKLCGNALNGQVLRGVRQEVLQAVYMDLAQNGIPASQLTAQPGAQPLTDKATLSMLDMMRWASYMLTADIALREEAGKTATLAAAVEQYIRQHYTEELDRSDIAAAFYLSPEHLGKVYKKQTGRNLKDMLAEYRIEQAKRLLNDPEQRIGDVAAAVGFDNFAYFSTVFKKYTGMTPLEFRRAAEESGRKD